MGVVYEASESQLGRRVALKILPFTASSDSRLIDRLHHEAQIVARLNHPHIVTVYGSGESEGVHYIAFQLVDGQSLDKSLRISFVGSNSPAPPTDKRPPAPPKIHWRWIATIGRDVAGALQHAHENGIIHRDIKPSNLLLDSTGKIWVTDFGLAMASDMSNLTATGDVLGTLRYMSPEQATGQRGVVDRRTDVYSLGITLYEMATGKPAFSGLSRAALLKHILFDTPPPIRQLISSIPRDLATIIGKATAKLPSERYYTAGELAADLRRFLDGQPIVAQPPTLADRARHFATRYRIPLMIAITSAFLLLTAWSVISQQHGTQLQNQVDLLHQAQRETARREWETLISVAQRGRMTSVPGRRQQGLASMQQAAKLLPQLTLSDTERSLFRDELIATLAVPLDVAPLQEVSFEHSVFHSAADDHLHFCARGRPDSTSVDLISLPEKEGRPSRRELTVDSMQLYYRFGAGGKYLTTETINGDQVSLSIWESATGKQTLHLVETSPFLTIWKEDGQTLALLTARGTVKILDAATGTLLHEWTVPSAVANYAWRPGTNQIAMTGGTRVTLYDAHSGTVLEEQDLPFAPVNIEWHPAGRLLLCQVGTSRSEQIIVWDWMLKRDHATLHTLLDRFLVPTAGDLIAIEPMTGESLIWDAVLGQMELRVRGRPVAFESNGKRFATCTNRAIHLWEIVRSDVLKVFAPAMHYKTELTDVGLSPDGRWLAVSGGTGIALIETSTQRTIEVSIPDSRSAQFVQSGPQLLLVSSRAGDPSLAGSGVRLEEREFDPVTGKLGEPVALFPLDRPAIYGFGNARRTGTGRFWAVANGISDLVVVDRESHTAKSVGYQLQLTNGTVSPDGQWAVSGFFHGQGVRLWDVAQARLDRVLWDSIGAANVEFSSDGKWLAVSASSETRVYETATWTVVLSRPRTDSSDISTPIAFSPDSRTLVLCENQTDLDLYQLPQSRTDDKPSSEAWTRVARLSSPEPAYGGMARFSADGRLLARANWSRVQLWNLETLRTRLGEQGLAW